MAKRGKVRRYTPEFIEQAIQLVKKGDKGQNEIAQELGVGQSTLSKWLARAEGSNTEVVDVAESVEEEVRRLRKRVRELEVEKEILKKATAYFAKENG